MKIYKCPKCGQEFKEGFVPSECIRCGCSSKLFTQCDDSCATRPSGKMLINNNAVRPSNNSSEESRSNVFVIIGLLIICFIIGGISYVAYKEMQEKAAQEQYARQEQERIQQEEERAERQRREAEEERRAQEEVEREIKRALLKFTGTYTSGHVNTGMQSGYGQICVTFYSDKTYDFRVIDIFTRNVLDRRTGTYTFFYDYMTKDGGGGRLLDRRGNLFAYYTIATLGYSIKMGDEYLTK